jgi:predicted TIM-barrel fold metal-dependent hydrolase
MKIIDAHCHIHKPEWVIRHSENDFLIEEFNCISSEEEILTNMNEADIDKTVIFPLPSIEVNLEAANLYTIFVSKLYPEKFIPFTIIDGHPEKWSQLGVKGFKEHTFGQRIQKDKYGKDIFSQKYKAAYKFIEQEGLPLLLHTGANRIDRIKNDMLKDTPNLKIILAHLGADFPKTNGHIPEKKQILNTLKELKSYSNIYYDITAIIDFEIIECAIEIVGVDKLIFGSDFPYEKPIETLKRINESSLTDEQKEKIYYQNILNVIEVRL